MKTVKNNIQRFCLSFIMLFTMVLVYGCGEKQPSHINDETPAATQDLFGKDPEESTAVNSGEESTGDNNTKGYSAILDNKEAADEEGVLWHIPNSEIESGLQQTIYLYQGNILLYGNEADYRNGEHVGAKTVLKLISMETGQVLQKAEYSGLELVDVQICDDVIALIDWSDGKIFLLDEQLKEVARHNVPVDYCTVYMSPDASYAYAFTQEEGIQITNLATGEQKILMDNAVSLFPANRCGAAVTFTYTDSETQMNNCGMIDMVSGEVQMLPFTGSFYDVEYMDGIWKAADMGSSNTYYLGQTERPNVFTAGEEMSEMTMLADTRQLMSTSYDDNGFTSMTLYSMDGSFLSRCKVGIEGAYVMGEPIWSEPDGGYYFLVLDSSGKDVLMFWDMTRPQSGMDLQFKAVQSESAPEGTAVSQELYDRAADISERYGVEVVIADRTDIDYGDYRIQQEFYEVNIETALDGVERVFSAYPEGFLPQLCYGDIREVELHLAGSLTKTDIPEGEVNGFTSFAGFAQEQTGKAVIVLDITLSGSMEQTLYHEIFHLIDNKLTFDAGIRSESDYSEEKWMNLNPAGFDYAWNTSVLPEEIFNEDYDVWFVDIYSRTFPREDRATIMEYASLGAEWMFISAEHRQAKLEYLCECIRDAFDTTGWPEVTVWEDALARSR